MKFRLPQDREIHIPARASRPSVLVVHLHVCLPTAAKTEIITQLSRREQEQKQTSEWEEEENFTTQISWRFPEESTG